jgi:hypothetical protein
MPPIRENAAKDDAWPVRGGHARAGASSLLHAPPVPCYQGEEAPERLPTPSTPCHSMSLALCAAPKHTRHGSRSKLPAAEETPPWSLLCPSHGLHHLRLFLPLCPAHLSRAIDRRRTVATGTATIELPVHMAGKPQATTDRAATTGACARSPRCS